uniref:Cytosolic endo-beta-N-acetylglucosaminidase n=1 Tax=Oryzias latipes TaxID=8090 RepID=A0A3P9HP78_ORYLA
MAETAKEIGKSTAKNSDERQTEAKRIKFESCLDQPEESSIYEVIRYGPSPLPARHYDPDTTEPTSCGLHTMEELLSWRRSEANPFNVASVPLAPREPSLGSCQRRTLVSHDMMGGYLDDRFIQGTNAETPYAFYHWCCIDIFNYFTHQLVSIPPVQWTNAAHKHGVIVLGTFITEWTDGATKCEAFLKDEESYRSVADKLVQISQCYGFDGWLINIENPLSEAAVSNAPPFLQYLTEQMHERVPSSLVLWYDSVIQSGELKWQNELNQSNRMFFDSCDGFFTNYNWTEQSLESMKDYSGVQGRQADVYVGVDVFARGEVVGGMLETNKALELIRKHNFSAAIFAPGWVYESLEDKTEFRQKQDGFWALLSEYLYVHRPATPLPFASSFCQGFGEALYWSGQKEKMSSWFNLSAQDLQPLYLQRDLEGGGWLRRSGCPLDAWSGGCSLLLDGLIPANLSATVCARIFSLHVPLDSRILVALIYKASPGISVSLQLSTDVHHFPPNDQRDAKTISLTPEALDNGHHLMKHFTHLHLDGNRTADGWTFRGSEVELRGCILRDVGVLIQRDGKPGDVPFSCRLGKIMVVDVASLEAPPPPVRGVCVEDIIWLRGSGTPPQRFPLLNATLRWEYSSELVHHFKVHRRRLRGPDPRIPPGPLELVGRAHANLFRVTALAVPEPPSLLELVVEPVLLVDVPVPEELWGRRQLSYTEAAAP